MGKTPVNPIEAEARRESNQTWYSSFDVEVSNKLKLSTLLQFMICSQLFK